MSRGFCSSSWQESKSQKKGYISPGHLFFSPCLPPERCKNLVRKRRWRVRNTAQCCCLTWPQKLLDNLMIDILTERGISPVIFLNSVQPGDFFPALTFPCLHPRSVGWLEILKSQSICALSIACFNLFYLASPNVFPGGWLRNGQARRSGFKRTDSNIILTLRKSKHHA